MEKRAAVTVSSYTRQDKDTPKEYAVPVPCCQWADLNNHFLQHWVPYPFLLAKKALASRMCYA